VASRALIFIVLAACAGPDPVLRGAAAAPSPLPGSTRVSLDIENRRGRGTIEIQLVLRGDGRVIRADRTLEREGAQDVHFETGVATRPGTYTVEATLEYPD